MSKRAVLAGATGLVGGHLLHGLLQSNRYSQVVSLGRRQLPVNDSKLVQRTADLGELLDLPEAESADVYCALGTTIRKAGSEEGFDLVDRQYVIQLAERAAWHKASQFLLVSSAGAWHQSKNFYLRTKGRAELEIALLWFDATHIFRPSFLVGERKESRIGERLGIAAAQALQFLMVGGARKYRPIAAATLAKAMIAAASHDVRGFGEYEYDQIQAIAAGAVPYTVAK